MQFFEGETLKHGEGNTLNKDVSLGAWWVPSCMALQVHDSNKADRFIHISFHWASKSENALWRPNDARTRSTGNPFADWRTLNRDVWNSRSWFDGWLKLGLAIGSLSVAGGGEAGWKLDPQHTAALCTSSFNRRCKFSRLLMENPLNEIRLLDALFESSYRFTRWAEQCGFPYLAYLESCMSNGTLEASCVVAVSIRLISYCSIGRGKIEVSEIPKAGLTEA